MSARVVEECGLCGSENLEVVFSLGSSPPTCVMQHVNGRRAASEEHHPLELLRCGDCSLVQLSVIVDPEVVFPADYPYSSRNSKGLHDNFEDLAKQAGEWVGALGPDDLVVDIGANDGTLLGKFGKALKIGVEPTAQSDRMVTSLCADYLYREFFSAGTAAAILGDHGRRAKVITACNVLAHVDNIHDVMRGIKMLLADDGILIAENHDLASVVTGCQWDTVYHEHLRYWDPYTFTLLLARHGLMAKDCQSISTHGGSFRTFADKSFAGIAPEPREYDFDRLQRRAQASRAALRNDLSGRVFGIGATARATTIINYCGLDVEDIECVCEVQGSDKIGHYIPGTRIPVVDEAALFDQQPARALLFSWHLADHIVPKLREAGYDGTFIVPLPRMEHRYPGSWMTKSPTARFG